MMADEPSKKEQFELLGFNSWVSEALAEREISIERVQLMSTEEILDEVLSWNGILGFTSSILNAVDNIHNVAG
jgi:hypothetical protein